MPVVSYVDPALVQDKETVDLKSITLSYTFHMQRDPSKPTVASEAGKSKSSL